MAEVFFYHIQTKSVEALLPPLLEKTLAKGWRALIVCEMPERQDVIDSQLWTYRDESFLPHGKSQDPHPEAQPILISDAANNENGAHCLFLVDGAEIDDPSGYERVVYLFDGRTEERLAQSRTYWTRLKDAGNDVTYWLENPSGGWEKKA